MSSPLYYLIEKKLWTTDGDHHGSPMDLKDGFIHLSTIEHLPHVAEKFFKGVENMLLVKLDPEKLKGEMKWITSKSSGAQYVHLFGCIPQEAVVDITELEPNAAGIPVV